MNDKMQDKIMEYMDSIAQGLGVAAEHVYKLMLQQKITEGIVYSLVLLLVTTALIIATCKIVKHTTTNWDDLYRKDHEFAWGFASVILGVVSLAFTIITVCTVPNYIMQVANPEYYVLKEILDAIK